MVDAEEYFPRGGKKPTVQYFKQTKNFLGTLEKGEKKRKKTPKKSEHDDGYLSDDFNVEFEKSSKNCAHAISYLTAKEGLLILGRVKQIFDTKIFISLPCRMKGAVMACHISEPYNKLLEAYVNDEVESVKELHKMFRPGQYVALRVLEVESDRLMLSMMPQHINGSMQHSDVVRGALFQVAVSSIEDHGYVMDLGIPNTRVFLPKANANEEIELDIGSITWCTVKSTTPSADNNIVMVTNQTGALREAVVRRAPAAGLLPGMAVDCHVDKALDNGIEGHIFRNTMSYIQRQHADTVKGKKPQLGERVRARFLYEMPIRKTPYLTMHNIFETTYPDLSKEQKFKEGEIVEDAQVIKITGRSVTFKLGKQCIGTMSLKNIMVDEELTDEDIISKSYPLGSEHKIRIISYNLGDYLYTVTDQKELLQMKYFTYDDLNVGDIVDATVRAVNENNITLAVGRLNGIVSSMHMSDSGLYIDPKKVSNSKLSKSKFKVGQSVKARVMTMKPDNSYLLLSLKPTLLSPDLEILKNYQDASIGKSYTGFIKLIRDYMLVSFFDQVVAYIPKYYISKEPIANLADAFHIGQIVNCTILKVDPEAKKMTGSLTTTPFYPNPKREKSQKKTKKDHKDIEETLALTNEIKQPREKKKRNASESSEGEPKQKRKKKKNEPKVDSDKVQHASEESDVIDTDIYEDIEILKPEDKILIDLKDCNTDKELKKRVGALKTSIEKRQKRCGVVDKKIQKIESKGLDSTNKKFHTAMNVEKHVLEERIDALSQALNVASERLRELPKTEPDFKVQKRKEEIIKKAAKKEAKKEATKEAMKEEKKIKREAEEKPKDVLKEKIMEIKVAGDSPALEVPSVKDFWSINAETLAKNTQDLNAEVESSSSDDDIAEEQPKKKRKKQSVAEKLARARAEEEHVRELERRAAAVGEGARPRSIAQFERALLATPNCSELWIAYMAFHLQATEVEKARAVGRKALKTISFREEHEKMNVWLAMLNFEHRFGTKESQQQTLEEALQMNDTFKIHSNLLDIYVETSKVQELNTLVDLMLRKYKREPNMYILCGTACYKLGMVEKARYVMQKSMTVLDKKEHVSVLVQFALLERARGSGERAEALLERVLGALPQRVDVCAVYVDMLHKGGDLERIRQVMERMTSQKLPARKMKILYKKWIEIEEKIGDATQVDRVREKAMEFIEKAQF